MKINHTGCSAVVAFLTEEYNIVTGGECRLVPHRW